MNEILHKKLINKIKCNVNMPIVIVKKSTFEYAKKKLRKKSRGGAKKS